MAPVRRNVTSLPAETVAAPTGQGRKLSRRPSKAVAAERKAHAMNLHAEKASRAQIAAELGISAETVKTWMLDKVAFPPHSVEPAAPDPRLVTAAALWAEGKSIADVAAAIGVPKPTLASWMRADRVRFPQRDRSAGARAVAARRRVSRNGSAPEIAERSIEVDEAPVSVDAAPVSAPIPADPVDAVPLSVADINTGPVEAADDRPARDDAFRPLPGFEPVALVDAASATCRWPVYPAGRSRFGVAVHCCGRATGDLKRSYCDTHARMAHGAGSSAERAALKLPRLSSPGSVPVVFASAVMGA